MLRLIKTIELKSLATSSFRQIQTPAVQTTTTATIRENKSYVNSFFQDVSASAPVVMKVAKHMNV